MLKKLKSFLGSDKAQFQKPDFEKILSSQLNMLDTLWERFVEHGVTDETKLVLEFDFICPNKEAANNLDIALEDYESHVNKNTEGQWEVSGKSDPTQVSKEILTQWIDFMVSLGCDHDCEFDGFGAIMPN